MLLTDDLADVEDVLAIARPCDIGKQQPLTFASE